MIVQRSLRSLKGSWVWEGAGEEGRRGRGHFGCGRERIQKRMKSSALSVPPPGSGRIPDMPEPVNLTSSFLIQLPQNPAYFSHQTRHGQIFYSSVRLPHVDDGISPPGPCAFFGSIGKASARPSLWPNLPLDLYSSFVPLYRTITYLLPDNHENKLDMKNRTHISTL